MHLQANDRAVVAGSIANGSSKKQVCADADVAYSSFMRWQARKTSIRAKIEEATRISWKKRRKDSLLDGFLAQQLARFNLGSHRHNRHPYRDPNSADQVDEADPMVAGAPGTN
jgi:hypothetical protein